MKERGTRAFAAGVLALLGAGLLASGETPSSAAAKDSALGLSKTSVFETPKPDPVADDTTSPGERPLLPRAYPGAPPRIPHGISDYVPITRQGGNTCLECHQKGEKKGDEPTPLPASHFVDWRNAPGQVRGEPAGARYVCVTCHVPQTGAAPLVGNAFGRPPVR